MVDSVGEKFHHIRSIPDVSPLLPIRSFPSSIGASHLVGDFEHSSYGSFYASTVRVEYVNIFVG